jgi:hypothetical protein
LFLALAQIISATVISLEEGDADTKRTWKWILDPMSPAFPLPRFPMKNGENSTEKEFRFLATLDCSAIQPGEVAMAVYDPAIDDWECLSTGNLPNDTSVPDDVVTGIPFNCSANYVAVWNFTTSEWDCDDRESLLFQSQPLIADNLCRGGDLLTVNYILDKTSPFVDRPAGLCVSSLTRQVGPDASVSLGKKRNLGDPDETFYVQSTSKAIGGLGSTGGNEHFGWQYWAWSPVRTSFAAGVGTYPPILAFDGMQLVAVTANTYSFSTTGNVWTATTAAVNFRVVRLTNVITGSGSTLYMRYDAADFTGVFNGPGQYLYSNTSSLIPNVALAKGNALSIRLTGIPPGLTGSPKNQWFSCSIWVSRIVAETA